MERGDVIGASGGGGGLFRVEHSVVDGFRSPQRVRVVELQQVDAAAGIRVAAAVHLVVTVASVDRNDLVARRTGVATTPTTTLHVARLRRLAARAYRRQSVSRIRQVAPM